MAVTLPVLVFRANTAAKLDARIKIIRMNTIELRGHKAK